MAPPTLELAREAARVLCERNGVMLVTPDSPSVLRTAVRLTITAATPLTLAEVEQRVSFYAPKVLAEVLALLPDPARSLVPLDSAAAMLSARAWGSPSLLCGVAPHEVGHHLQDRRARDAAGIVGSLVHGVAYVVHDTVRGDSEGTCYTHDLTAAVVVDGADPDAFRAGILDVLRSTYRLDAHAIEHAAQSLRSAVASLKARQLPGVNTPLHQMLRLLVAGGWDPGPWASAIGGAA